MFFTIVFCCRILQGNLFKFISFSQLIDFTTSTIMISAVPASYFIIIDFLHFFHLFCLEHNSVYNLVLWGDSTIKHNRRSMIQSRPLHNHPCTLSPQSCQHRDYLFFSGYHTGQETGVIFEFFIKRMAENFLIAQI